MDVKGIWLDDPSTKAPSVSLTLLVFSFSLLVAVGVLYAFGKVASFEPFNQTFWGMAALYFARRNINVGGKTYGSSDKE